MWAPPAAGLGLLDPESVSATTSLQFTMDATCIDLLPAN